VSYIVYYPRVARGNAVEQPVALMTRILFFFFDKND